MDTVICMHMTVFMAGLPYTHYICMKAIEVYINYADCKL